MSKYNTSLFENAITIGDLRKAYATAKEWLDGGALIDNLAEARHNNATLTDELERWINLTMAWLVVDMATAREAIERHNERWGLK